MCAIANPSISPSALGHLRMPDPEARLKRYQDREGEGFEMRAPLFAPLILALSLATATAQVLSQSPLPRLTAEQEAQCREEGGRSFPRTECDNTRGCFSPTPEEVEREVERATSQCRLQLRA